MLSTIVYSGFVKEKRGGKLISLSTKRDNHLSIALSALKVVNTFLGSHFEDCSSGARNQKLNMELFAALVFSYSIVLSLCSVHWVRDQPDIVKRMETCQEGINTVSEQSVTWPVITERLYYVLAFLGQYLDPVLYTTNESQ